jgi:hypothetical protein
MICDFGLLVLIRESSHKAKKHINKKVHVENIVRYLPLDSVVLHEGKAIRDNESSDQEDYHHIDVPDDLEFSVLRNDAAVLLLLVPNTFKLLREILHNVLVLLSGIAHHLFSKHVFTERS